MYILFFLLKTNDISDKLGSIEKYFKNIICVMAFIKGNYSCSIFLLGFYYILIQYL